MMRCRAGCGACCIAPSINTPMPGMPFGKKAGERCLHLDDRYMCRLFGHAERPSFCLGFQAEESVCGKDRDEAIKNIGWLEGQTG